MNDSALFKKVYGSVAAANIGSAIGAAVEWVSVPGGGWKAVEDHFGWVDQLLPWTQMDRDVRYWNNSPPLHYYHMEMPPGMTEDGAEIRYLLSKVIIQKKGRITVEDLAETWRSDIQRTDIGKLVNPHIIIHYDRLMAGDENTRIHPKLIGSMTPWPGLVDAAHMIGPVGVVNACNPRQAALDTEDICLLLQPPASGGIEGSKVIAAATAEAFKPGATVESVVKASKTYVSLHTRQIIDEVLEIADRYPDVREIREPIRKHFMPTYPYADAVETAAEAVALFLITKGDVREGLVGATNLGRDTDCIAGMLGSICGAFKGIDGVPDEWVDRVQKAIDENRVTMQEMSMRETAEGLTEAVLNNLATLEEQVQQVTGLYEAGKI